VFWLHYTLNIRWKRGWIAALGDVGNAEALTWLSQLGYYYCGILCMYSIRKCSKSQRASFVVVMTGHLLCWATENVTVATALLRWWLARQQVPAWYGQCGLRTVSLPDSRSAVIWRSTNDTWHSCACITKSNKKLLKQQLSLGYIIVRIKLKLNLHIF